MAHKLDKEKNKSPIVVFRERHRSILIHPMDPESLEAKSVVALAFINQAAPDIKSKLQSIENAEEK